VTSVRPSFPPRIAGRRGRAPRRPAALPTLKVVARDRLSQMTRSHLFPHTKGLEDNVEDVVDVGGAGDEVEGT
jgi:hypothetical protein